MVKNLHNAGIEVILDVVYNHTAEGNQLGPPCVSRASENVTTIAWSQRTSATTLTTQAQVTRSM